MRATAVVLCLASVLPLAGQELIDRIAVTVGKHVITEGEIYDQMRLTGFLNGEKVEFSPEEKRKAAERLVEQYLIRQEMQINRYPEPENTEAEKMLAELVNKRFGSRDKFESTLKEYGVTRDEVKANLLWQLTALRFTDLRFRPALEAPKEPLRQHLEKETEERTAAKAAAPVKPGRVEPKTDNAEDYAAGPPRDGGRPLPQSVDDQMAKWLDEARTRTRIEYRQDVFR